MRVDDVAEVHAVVEEMTRQNIPLGNIVYLALVESYRRTRQPAR